MESAAAGRLGRAGGMAGEPHCCLTGTKEGRGHLVSRSVYAQECKAGSFQRPELDQPPKLVARHGAAGTAWRALEQKRLPQLDRFQSPGQKATHSMREAAHSLRGIAPLDGISATVSSVKQLPCSPALGSYTIVLAVPSRKSITRKNFESDQSPKFHTDNGNDMLAVAHAAYDDSQTGIVRCKARKSGLSQNFQTKEKIERERHVNHVRILQLGGLPATSPFSRAGPARLLTLALLELQREEEGEAVEDGPADQHHKVRPLHKGGRAGRRAYHGGRALVKATGQHAAAAQ